MKGPDGNPLPAREKDRRGHCLRTVFEVTGFYQVWTITGGTSERTFELQGATTPLSELTHVALTGFPLTVADEEYELLEVDIETPGARLERISWKRTVKAREYPLNIVTILLVDESLEKLQIVVNRDLLSRLSRVCLFELGVLWSLTRGSGAGFIHTGQVPSCSHPVPSRQSWDVPSLAVQSFSHLTS